MSGCQYCHLKTLPGSKSCRDCYRVMGFINRQLKMIRRRNRESLRDRERMLKQCHEILKSRDV